MTITTAKPLIGSLGARSIPMLIALTLAASAAAEPTRFDWRYHVEDGPVSDSAEPVPPEDAPNPVVLPMPEVEQEEENDTGWHWMAPRIAGSPGGTSGRTAIQLAEQAQQEAMAQRHSPLNSLLPGSLRGLAPMAVESGVEWRF